MSIQKLLQNQIKSAISNKGTFDPNSKDINEDNSIDNILKQFKNIPEIVRYDWDKVAFGFSVDDEIRININDLKVKYKDDLENAIYKIDNEKKFGRHFKDSFDDLPSIEVSYENGKFYIEDGHHRYYYAKKNNINNVKVKIVDIKENPIIKMGYNSIDDLIKRYKEIKDEL